MSQFNSELIVPDNVLFQSLSLIVAHLVINNHYYRKHFKNTFRHFNLDHVINL